MSVERARNDWLAVAAYALLAGVSQLLWLTYAPITSESAAHFGVSKDAVGWLAEIFPLLYVLLAVPAALLLDRWLRQTLIAAAFLMLAGAGVRMLGESYALALAGQLLIAIAQPAVLAAVTKVAAERVEPDSRTLAISIGSAGMFAGLVLALVLGATVGARDDLRPLLLINLSLALLAAITVTLAMRRPAARSASESVALGLRELRVLYTDPVLSRLGAMTFLGMGVFNALATWLEVLLGPIGISTSQSSWILVTMSVAGVIAAVSLPPLVTSRGAERTYLQVAAVAGALGLVVVTRLTGVTELAIVFGCVGLFLMAAQPVILGISERRAGHAAASAAGAILLAGNLGGIVLAVIVQTVKDDAQAAFFVLALAMLLIGPIARSLPDWFAAPSDRTRSTS